MKVAKRRAATRQSIAEIRGLRALYELELDVLPVGPSERELVARLDLASRSRELSELGFRPLGDLRVTLPGRTVTGVMRVFTDGTHTILGVVSDTDPVRGPGLGFISYTEETTWSTVALGQSVIETGPALRHQDLPWMTNTRNALARHQELVDGAGSLAPVTSILEGAERLRASHAAVAAWRRAQDPDELLDRDLRVYLEDEYLRRPAFWKSRVVSRVPAARVVQRDA